MQEYTLKDLIVEALEILIKEGNIPVYVFDEYDKAYGKNTLSTLEVLEEEKSGFKRPKRVEIN